MQAGEHSHTPWKSHLAQLAQMIELREWHLVYNFLYGFIQVGRQDRSLCFESDVLPILEACKRLDVVAHEKEFREILGSSILQPLLSSLQETGNELCAESVKNYIRTYLSFGDFGQVKQPSLFDHQSGNFEEYILSTVNDPYCKLADMRSVYLKYLQESPVQYEEAALIYTVIDYWRVLKAGSFSIFAQSDPVPLLQLEGDLLVLANKTNQELKRVELWRLILLLQVLISDHPKTKLLPRGDWSPHVFRLNSSVVDEKNMWPPVDFGICTLLKDYKPVLIQSREVFTQMMLLDVLSAQHKHTENIITMLNEMILAVSAVLGQPPCELAICALGSTSRFDRRPFSDLELLVLHNEPEIELEHHERKRWDAHVAVYIFHAISLLELMIVRLQETPKYKTSLDKHNAGFHLDSRCHVLMKDMKGNMKWGTPKQIIARNFSEIDFQQNVKKGTHPWKDDVNFYALLQPILLHPGKLGGDVLLLEFQSSVRLYLDQKILPTDFPHLIAQQLGLRAEWSNFLVRRQGIALACMQDIVAKSVSCIKYVKVGDKVDIKNIYYKPLAYCAINLSLYFEWQCASPQKIIEHYAQTLPWGGEAVMIWWSTALAYVAKHQVKMHVESKHQEEEAIYAKDFFWAGMDLIYCGFIVPLQCFLQKNINGELLFHEVGFALLKNFLNVRRIWLEKWQKNVDRDVLLSHPLLQALATYPDESGWSPRMELVLNQHLFSLEKLTQPQPPTLCQFSGLPDHQKILYFENNLAVSCFGEAGKFVGEEQWSGDKSQVRRVVGLNQQAWFIKVKQTSIKNSQGTGLLAREYSAMMLHLLLGGEKQIALGWPVKLGYVNGSILNPTYAWVSEDIPGTCLATVMRMSPEKISKEMVDIECFSQLFLFCFLTCPEDGQPENFQVIEAKDKVHLIAYDYGQCFVQAEHTNKNFFSKNTQVLTVKTMVYLLESMSEPLASDLITRIRLLDIEQWFDRWKESIYGINEIFKQLLEEDSASLSQEDGDGKSLLIDLDEGVFECIKSRLALFQHWVRTTNKIITGNNALMDLEPLVALQYASLQGQIKTPEDFYEKLDARAYKLNKKGKMVSSTSYELIKERTITPQHLQHSCDIDQHYFRRINFHYLNDDQQRFSLDLLESVTKKYGDRFFVLNLSGCRIINQDDLLKLLKMMPNLEELDVCEVKKIGAITICEILSLRFGAAFLGGNQNFLCPRLKKVKIKINGEYCLVELNLSINDRIRLAESLKVFIRWHNTFLKNVMKFFSRPIDGYEHTARMLRVLDCWDEKIRAALIRVALAGDANQRIVAIETLGLLNYWDDGILDALLKVAKINYSASLSSVAVRAFRALGHWDVKIRDVLLQIAADNLSTVRTDALSAIGALGHWDEQIHEVLLQATKDNDHLVVETALCALGDLGHCAEGDKANEIRDVMLMAAKSDQTCQTALTALGKLGQWDVEIRAVLLQAAADPDTESWVYRIIVNPFDFIIHWMAKLQQLGWRSDIGKDRQVWVQRTALSALGILGHWDPEIGAVLFQAALSTEEKVRQIALEALEKLGHSNAEIREALLAAAAHENKKLRQIALSALGDLGHWHIDIRKALLKGCKAKDSHIREAALTSLGKLGRWDLEIHEAVLLAANDDIVHGSALEALGRLGHWDIAVREVLLKAARNPQAEFRCYRALEALGRLGYWDVEIQEALLKAAISPGEHSRVRLAAFIAVGELGQWNVDIRTTFLKAIKFSDFDTPQAALQMLVRLGGWDEGIAAAVLKALTHPDSKIDIAVLYSPAGCLNYLRQQIKSLPSNTQRSINDPEFNTIIKRIFFFVDDGKGSGRALPCVSTKWRSLYDEFRDDQYLHDIVELRVPTTDNNVAQNSGGESPRGLPRP